MCATKLRSPQPLRGPTPSSTRSRPMSRRVSDLRGGARARGRDGRTGGCGRWRRPPRACLRHGRRCQSGSPYIRARGRGEKVVQKTFPEATIVRPGAMFGPGDALFGTLADLVRLLPILPLIGGGHPTAASLRGRRRGGYRQHTHRPWNRRPDLRACRSRSVHATRAGQDHATLHGQTATANTSAFYGGRDAGAAVRTSAKPTAHHRPS